MPVDNCLGDGKAQPGMLAEILTSGPDAVKAVKYGLPLILGNAGAFILNIDIDALAIASCRDPNRSILR